MKQQTDFDVIIVGGGLACALALVQLKAELKIAVKGTKNTKKRLRKKLPSLRAIAKQSYRYDAPTWQIAASLCSSQ